MSAHEFDSSLPTPEQILDLVGAIALQISQSIELEQLFKHAVMQVGQFLQAEQVLIRQTSTFTTDPRDLIAPIWLGATLWGELVVQRGDDRSGRHSLEQRLVQQVALQLGIAVQQADLRQQLQQQQQAETKLRQYERIVSATPDCVALLDCNYVYQVINQPYTLWHNKPSEEIVGHSVLDLFGPELFYNIIQPRLERCFMGEPQIFEAWADYVGVGRRFIRGTYSPYIELDGTISGAVIHIHDLTDLKLTETALQISEAKLSDVLSSAIASITSFRMFKDETWEYDYISSGCETVFGYPPQAFRENKLLWMSRIVVSDQLKTRQQVFDTVFSAGTAHLEYRFWHRDGSIRWISETLTSRWDAKADCWIVTLVSQDDSDRKNAELALQRRIQREQTLNQVFQTLRNSLDLKTIFASATAQVDQLLPIEQAAIFQYIAERRCWRVVATHRQDPTLFDQIGLEIPDEDNPFSARLKQADIIQINGADEIEDELNRSLANQAPGAWLLVPIVVNTVVWGCFGLRVLREFFTWESEHIELARVLADQLAIAIQQSELYAQVQQLNANLEQQVRERTAQLQQALTFEALLQRITDKVRDSLDESQILQTVVQELGVGLQLDCCDSGIYNAEQTMTTVGYEYLASSSYDSKRIEPFYLEAYPPLGHGEPCQFCPITFDWVRPDRAASAILAAPIRDNEEILGDLWLFRPTDASFSELEIRLVKQVANHCAIALRQSRLYQNSLAYVDELERLNQLKDDFLSTVSHELRSPMANIKMATQMLEIQLTRLGILPAENSGVSRYFRVLRDEGEREIRLINDLLDLTRLDAHSETLVVRSLHLQPWVAQRVVPLTERMRSQHQRLELTIAADLVIDTDDSYLDRILTELLYNACKYTPAGETIRISAQPVPDQTETIAIQVSNSGIEIPGIERDRVFDKFYRIPNNDPWKHGGTGLGLALVKKLVERLQGRISVASQSGWTTFTVELPTHLEHLPPATVPAVESSFLEDAGDDL